MRVKFWFIGFALFYSFCAFAQKKPTIMILPSDNWCNQRYFMTSFSNQGSTVKVPNYQQAFMEDTELPLVISKVGGVLTGLGYSLKDAEQEIKSIATKTAEDNVTYSKTSGAALNETPLDVLKRRVKSDNIIQIWWKLNRDSKGHSASFTLEALASDAYRNLTPTWYDTMFKGRFLETVENAVMFDLIHDSIVFDTGRVFGAYIDVFSAFRKAASSKNWVSYYNASKGKWNTAISKINQSLG